MVKIEIKGEQHTIGEVFSDRYTFVVPPYQRPYAWTTEHAGQMLDDLLGYLGDEEPIEDLSPYFLGSIVLIKGERPEAQIVDGQQRLITLTILLAVLRALTPPEIGESITKRLYEPADPLNGLPARHRVRPKDRDALFFQTYMLDAGGIAKLHGHLHPDLSDSQRNMRENALYYLREVGEMPEARRMRLARFVIQRCLLVLISTPDMSAAYRIFSVLNDRGLDLSSADILKAEVIGQIPEHEQQEYTARWEQTEESLGRDDFTALFSHLAVIYRKGRKLETVLDNFRAYVAERVGDSRQVVNDVIAPYGAAFSVLRNASYAADAGAEQVNTLLIWLNRVDNADWIPPALLYLTRYHEQPERLVRFLTELERLAASLMIRRQYANKRTTRYAKLLAAIERGENLSLPSSPIQLTPDERETTLSTLGGDLYLMPPQPRNYVLLRLDSHLAGTAQPAYGARLLTVEHVLPRSPAAESEWMRAFPSAEERARWVHKLGNLALLSRTKNASAWNYDFARKKAIYFSPRRGVVPYALTTQILNEREWTPAVVARRQRELLDHLKQLWRL